MSRHPALHPLTVILAFAVAPAARAVAHPDHVAFWRNPDKVLEASISFADLDPRSAKDAAVLAKRIEFASDAVCRDAINEPADRARSGYQRCYAATIDRALERLRNAQVTALASRTSPSQADQ